MRLKNLALIVLAACRTTYVDGHEVEVVTVDIRASIRPSAVVGVACSDITPSAMSAQVLIQTGDGTEVEQICDLAVTSEEPGELLLSGGCPEVEAKGTKLITLLLRAQGGAEPVLLELAGQAILDHVTQRTVLLSFEGVENPKVAETKTLASTAARARFNCDISGDVSVCNDASVAAAEVAPVDNCSNLAELCRGTLFKQEINSDCEGVLP